MRQIPEALALRALGLAALLALATSLAPSRTLGQATDTVAFVHGLMQNGSHWGPLSSDLAARHPIFPWAPNLPSQSYYSTQAATFGTQLSSAYGGGLYDIAAVSHSNGGVVVREYVRTSASPRSNRHLTLGTPHQGALLAQRIQDGTLAYYALIQLPASILEPVIYYAAEDPDWDDLWLAQSPSFYIEASAFTLHDLLEFTMPAGMTAMGYLLDQWVNFPQILPDMWPGSGTFAALSAAQGSEAQKLSEARVGISSKYPTELAPWRALFAGRPAPSIPTIQAHVVWQDLMAFAWEAYQYYLFHPDFDLRDNAYLWQNMFFELAYVPYYWEAMIGAGPGQHDGIVPWSSSNYPGGTANYQVTGYPLVHHTEQLDGVPNHDTDPFRLAVSHAIEEDLGIVEPPPPPPPLEVEIVGPEDVRGSDTCTWQAQVSGGEGPYTYAWSGALNGSNSLVSGQVAQSGWLYLTVSTATEQESAQFFVSVSASAPFCPA